MASGPRIVAELGRPETPDETAARKAESSRVYRSSQTFRNLVAALLATLGVVLVIALIVPRGDPTPPAPIDATAVAKQAASSYGRTVVLADVPSSWRVNTAGVDGDETWTVTYAPKDDPGFVRVSQGFDADEAWEVRLLNGAASTGTVDIDGITWTVYEIADPSRAANVSYAIGTQAGHDRILIYGSASPSTTAIAARGLADQIHAMNGAAR